MSGPPPKKYNPLIGQPPIKIKNALTSPQKPKILKFQLSLTLAGGEHYEGSSI